MEVNSAVFDSTLGIRGDIYSEINFHQFLQLWYFVLDLVHYFLGWKNNPWTNL